MSTSLKDLISKFPKFPEYVGMTAEQLQHHVYINRLVGRTMKDIQRDLIRIAWARGKKVVFCSDDMKEVS